MKKTQIAICLDKVTLDKNFFWRESPRDRIAQMGLYYSILYPTRPETWIWTCSKIIDFFEKSEFRKRSNLMMTDSKERAFVT